MTSYTVPALFLFATTPAFAGMLGTDVTLDFGDGITGCLITETVVDPGVEWVDAGPDLCMAGPTGRLDVDVTDTTVRFDFTAEQDIGTAGTAAPMFTLNGIHPTCPGGSTGWVDSIVSVSTNMDPNEWIPTQVAFADDEVQLIADPASLDGDVNLRTHPGDFIELELAFGCPAPALGLTLTGTCPGSIDIDIVGITPGGQVGVIFDASLGSGVIGGGPCAGTVTDLDTPSLDLIMVDTDGDGEIHVSPSVSAHCGEYMQIVDRTTCDTSNVELL